MDYKAAYERELQRRIDAEQRLDEKEREVESSLNMIRYQYASLANQKKGLELLLNVAQMGELRLEWEAVLGVFLDAMGQLFEADYGIVFILRPDQAGNQRLLSSTICHLPLDSYPDETLALLKSDREFDVDSSTGKKVLEGNNVIRIHKSATEVRSGPDWLVYFPIRKKGKIVAVAEFGVNGWKKESEAYLTLAMAASAQIGVMLERADAHQKLQKNFQALQDAHEQLKSAQTQLVHSEKMASIGQLAAGVAHEINNPVGFVLSNIDTLQEYVTAIVDVYNGYERYINAVESSNPEATDIRDEITAAKSRHDISFILDDIEQVILDSNDGLNRVKDIVLSLKNFARADEGKLNQVSLDNIVGDAIKMIYNELKYHVDLECSLRAPTPILCNAAQLSQVVVNLTMNAAQAITDRGTITIKTEQDATHTHLHIIDTGCGIPAEKIGRIFDPFFTTKPINLGTGLGLSISHGIIEKHGGTITVQSEEGKGTHFHISVPNAAPGQPDNE